MTEKNKGVLALTALAFVWAIQGLLPRYLSTSLQLFQQVYLRFALGAVFTAIIFYRQINFAKIFSVGWRDWWPLIGRAASYYLLGVTLFTQSVLLTKLSNVSFINALPLTALIGWLVFKEKVNLKKFGLVILAFIGAALIMVKNLSSLSGFGWGELLAFISLIFVSLGMLIRKWEREVFNTYESSFLVILLAAILVFIAALFKGETLLITTWNSGMMLVLFFAGLFNAAIVILVTYGFSRIEGVLAGNLLQLEVPLTVFLAYLFYHETPILKDAIGGTLIILSAYLMNRLEAES